MGKAWELAFLQRRYPLANIYPETVFTGDSKGNANLSNKELPHLLEWLASKRQ